MKTKIKLQLVSIQGDGYHIFFKIIVNGTEARFLIDTGASKTVLDKAFVNTLKDIEIQTTAQLTTGIGTSTLESEFTDITSLEIGKLELNNVHVAVIDLSHVNQTYHSIGLPELNGVLGGDLLTECKAIIDYSKKKMFLKTGKKKKKKARPAAEEVKDEIITTESVTNNEQGD